eukprot:3240536-Pyramimonas_sp.AAC.1
MSRFPRLHSLAALGKSCRSTYPAHPEAFPRVHRHRFWRSESSGTTHTSCNSRRYDGSIFAGICSGHPVAPK